LQRLLRLGVLVDRQRTWFDMVRSHRCAYREPNNSEPNADSDSEPNNSEPNAESDSPDNSEPNADSESGADELAYELRHGVHSN
jgi:hypothetical protein